MATLNFDLILLHLKEFMQGLSWFYPVPEHLLTKYEKVWDWEWLSKNRAIQWNASLLEKFQHKWNWGYDGLSNNTSIPWSPELLEQFKDKWSWYHLGWQPGIVNNPDMLYMCLPHWNDCQENLFSSYGATIDKQHHLWIEKVFENWPALNWKSLSRYDGFPWTEDFIRRHAEKLDWDELSRNTGLPWSIKFIREHLHRWNWWCLSMYSGIAWNIEIIDSFKDHLNWYRLSIDEFIQWSNDILIAFKDRFYWVTTGLDESLDLDKNSDLDENSDIDFDMGDINGLYNNPMITWTPELYEILNKTIENQFKCLAEEEKKLLEANRIVLKENEHWTVYQNGNNWTEPYMKMLIDLGKQYSGKVFINWALISQYFKDWESYSKETIDYCKTQISLDALTKNPYFPWHQHPDIFNKLAEYKKDWEGWNHLSANQGLKMTEEMIDQYKDKWDWSKLSRNTSLTPALINKYKDQIDWDKIYSNPIFTPDIIEAHPKEINWGRWWQKNYYFGSGLSLYDNFARLLHIPVEGYIEQWVDHNLLEEILLKIVNKTPNE